MANRMRWASGICLAGIVLLVGFGSSARAQQVIPDTSRFTSGMTPQFPPAGDWAEVVTVTPKWIVLQNDAGQQFPVAFDAIGQFMIRWPTTVENISPTALIEALGVDMRSNQISTDHVDVFEGSARQLVTPMFQRVIGFNRTPTDFDLDQMNTYGVVTHLFPGEEQIPDRHHIVGQIMSRAPLTIGAPGNNALTVFPSLNGMMISEVTMGSATFLKAGDQVYLVPADYSPRTMMLSQMIGYKKMPLNQFVP